MRDRSFFGTVIAMLFLVIALHTAGGVIKAAPVAVTAPCVQQAAPPAVGTQQAAKAPDVKPQAPVYCPCGRSCVLGYCWCQSCVFAIAKGGK